MTHTIRCPVTMEIIEQEGDVDSDAQRARAAALCLDASNQLFALAEEFALQALDILQPSYPLRFEYNRLNTFRDLYSYPSRFSWTFNDARKTLLKKAESFEKGGERTELCQPDDGERAEEAEDRPVRGASDHNGHA